MNVWLKGVTFNSSKSLRQAPHLSLDVAVVDGKNLGQVGESNPPSGGIELVGNLPERKIKKLACFKARRSINKPGFICTEVIKHESDW